jgi:hypothetical protein
MNAPTMVIEVLSGSTSRSAKPEYPGTAASPFGGIQCNEGFVFSFKHFLTNLRKPLFFSERLTQ